MAKLEVATVGRFCKFCAACFWAKRIVGTPAYRIHRSNTDRAGTGWKDATSNSHLR
jgi:hypothetical protein